VRQILPESAKAETAILETEPKNLKPAISAPGPDSSKRKLNLNYGVGVGGGLALILCGFLPWITVRYATINQYFSLSGRGTISGSVTVAELSQMPLTDTGLMALGLGSLAIILALTGLFFNRTELAAFLTLLGLFSIVVTVYWLSDSLNHLKEVKSLAGGFFNTIEPGGLHISPLMKAGVDYGLPIAIIAAFLIMLGGLLPMAGKQPKKRRGK